MALVVVWSRHGCRRSPAAPINARIARAAAGRQRRSGGFQQIAHDPPVVVDVAHNPAAARMLRDQLAALPGRKFAVFAALGDKDVAVMARILRPVIERWFPASLAGPRGLSAGALSDRIRSVGVETTPDALESVAEALERARAECLDGDSIIVFGSFLTVAAAFEAISRRNAQAHG
ncbi:MAG: glutamate ligase domain-containing protein [Wenzhouxiangellaceae bacterium]